MLGRIKERLFSPQEQTPSVEEIQAQAESVAGVERVTFNNNTLIVYTEMALPQEERDTLRAAVSNISGVGRLYTQITLAPQGVTPDEYRWKYTFFLER